MRKYFTKQQRLLTASQFAKVFEQPKKVVSANFVALATSNQLTHPRLGLAIAKKTVKLACGRNRVKRLVRESFRQKQHDLSAIDIVILARRGIEQLDKITLRQQLDQLWQRLQKRFQY